MQPSGLESEYESRYGSVNKSLDMVLFLWLIYIAGNGFGMDSDSNYKHDGYIVLYKCSHCKESDSRFLFPISV